MPFKIIIVFAFSLFFSALANGDLVAQRENYQKMMQILKQPTSDYSLNLSQQMLSSLQDYPLYPYAQYAWLNAQPSFDWQQVSLYQSQQPTHFLTTKLIQNWLQQQQKAQQWQEILQHQSELPSPLLNNNVNRCVLWQAKTMLAPQPQLDTALSADIQKLWLTGKNLPTECDGIVQLWQQNNGLSEELLQQRALLALEENNLQLLNALSLQTKNDNLKNELQTWLKWRNSPTELPNFISQLEPSNPAHRRILLVIFPYFIKSTGEASLNTADPFVLFSNWANQFQLNEAQQKQWRIELLTHIFDTEDQHLQQWRDAQLIELKEDKLTERRIRSAIRQQQDLKSWLDLLSEQTRNKEEWRYWQGWLVWQGGDSKGEQILQKLSAERGFFAMLAAQALNLEYQPKMQEIEPIIQQGEGWLQKPELISLFARIQELRYLQQNNIAKQEWLALLQNVEQSQMLLLADYATQQQWFDLAVEATIKAKSWGYIRLRLPLAYLDWFNLHLANLAQLYPTQYQNSASFVMAIARQESAWNSEARSTANARGLMQLLPTTALRTAKNMQLPYLNEKQLFDPFINIMLGTAHLQELAQIYQGNRILMAAAYNAGAKRVESWLKKNNGKLTMAEFVSAIPFYETRGYVQNVLVYDYYYQQLQGLPALKFSKQESDRLY